MTETGLVHDGGNPYRAPQATPPPPRVSALEALRFVASGAIDGTAQTILLASLCFFIPVVGPIMLKGYQADMVQRLVRREPQRIPPLSLADFGAHLERGVATFAVEMVLAIPLTFALMVGMGFGLGIAVALARATGSSALPAFLPFTLLVLPLAVAATMPVLNAGVTRAMLSEDLGHSLQLGSVLAYARRTYGQSILAMAVFALLAMPLMLCGLAAFFVGVVPMAAFLQLAMAHLRWQLYEASLASGGPPIALKPQRLPPVQVAPVLSGYGGYQPPPTDGSYATPRYPDT